MRIVDRKTFLALPCGTLFAKYEPCVFGELAIKEETSAEIDFYVQDIIPWFEGAHDDGQYFNMLDRMAAGEQPPPLDYNIVCRDGYFDEDQLFAVFDRSDTEALIARLQRALADSEMEKV
jgi:hypothetical protein